MSPPTEHDVQPGRLRLAGRILAIAVGAGLTTGLIEALWLWLDQAVRGRVIFTSDYILWMTPLLYALIFAVVGLGLAALAAALYPRVREPVAVFLMFALGVGCLFLPITQIARWAAVIVALGAAVQAAKLAASRPRGFRRAARLSLGTLASLAAILYLGDRALADRPSSGPPARADLPNIVLIVWDTVRAENLGLHGYDQPTTPVLEELAERSIVFDRAVAPSPWTLPTHGSMFTGRWPHELSTSWFERLDDAHPTVAEIFTAHGYDTGGFVANHHYTSYDSGLDRGFARWADYRVSWRQFLRSSWLTQTGTMGRLLASRGPGEAWAALRALDFWVGVKRANDRKHAAEVNAELLAWLDGLGDRPFFAFVNQFDAHAAYWSPPGTVDRFTTEDRAMRAYDAAISHLDAELGSLIEALRERGKLDNTIFVITSDHGELFGENGLRGHAHNLYYRTLHVPLVVHAPGRLDAARRVSAEVSLRDLAITLLDLAGIEDEGGRIPGASLLRYADGAAAPPLEPLLAEVEEGRNNPPGDPISRGPMRSVLNGGLHYILNGDGVEELYDYRADPREESDLASDPATRVELVRLRAALEGFGRAERLASSGR